MVDPDPARHHQNLVPRARCGRRGGAARSELPHGVVHHADIRELLRNSAMHFGGNEATVAHLLDLNYRNLISGEPRMQTRQGIALYGPLNRLTQHDAPRLAHGLLGARRHASAQSRDLYTAAIDYMGYRFDGHGHIHKVQHANFSAAVKNPAFRAHMMVEHYVAMHQTNVGHEGLVAAGRQVKSPTHSSYRGTGSGVNGIDRSGRGGSLGNRRAPAPKP